jgi:hypothetical protein
MTFAQQAKFQLVGSVKGTVKTEEQRMRLRASGNSSADPEDPSSQTNTFYSSFGFVKRSTDDPLNQKNSKDVATAVIAPFQTLVNTHFKESLQPFHLVIVPASAHKAKLVLRHSNEKYIASEARVQHSEESLADSDSTAFVEVLREMSGTNNNESLDAKGLVKPLRKINCKCKMRDPLIRGDKPHASDIEIAEIPLSINGSAPNTLPFRKDGDKDDNNAPVVLLSKDEDITLADRLDSVVLALCYQDISPPGVADGTPATTYNREITLTAYPYFRELPTEPDYDGEAHLSQAAASQAAAEKAKLSLKNQKMTLGKAHKLYGHRVAVSTIQKAAPPFLEIQTSSNKRATLCLFGSYVGCDKTGSLKTWGSDKTPQMPLAVRMEYAPSARIVRDAPPMRCIPNGIVVRASAANNVRKGTFVFNEDGKPIASPHPDAQYVIVADSVGQDKASLILASGSDPVSGAPSCALLPEVTRAETILGQTPDANVLRSTISRTKAPTEKPKSYLGKALSYMGFTDDLKEEAKQSPADEGAGVQLTSNTDLQAALMGLQVQESEEGTLVKALCQDVDSGPLVTFEYDGVLQVAVHKPVEGELQMYTQSSLGACTSGEEYPDDLDFALEPVANIATMWEDPKFTDFMKHPTGLGRRGNPTAPSSAPCTKGSPMFLFSSDGLEICRSTVGGAEIESVFDVPKSVGRGEVKIGTSKTKELPATPITTIEHCTRGDNFLECCANGQTKEDLRYHVARQKANKSGDSTETEKSVESILGLETATGSETTEPDTAAATPVFTGVKSTLANEGASVTTDGETVTFIDAAGDSVTVNASTFPDDPTKPLHVDMTNAPGKWSLGVTTTGGGWFDGPEIRKYDLEMEVEGDAKPVLQWEAEVSPIPWEQGKLFRSLKASSADSKWKYHYIPHVLVAGLVAHLGLYLVARQR